MATNLTPPETSVDQTLAKRIPVIEYHGTEYSMGASVQMKSEWFLSQLQWLSDNGYQTLTGEQLIDFTLGVSRPPQKSCAIRFDLGLAVAKNVEEVVIPALEKHGFRALFFVLTSSVKDESKDDFLTWDQIRAWEGAGLIETGSHGVYHPNYKKINQVQRKWDAKTSKDRIEENLGHAISLFAYPYDSVPTRPDLLLKPLGYRLAFAGYRIQRCVLFKDPSPYALPCYYPYSNNKIYPKINGTKGLTFGQMIEASIA
jgi:peptidoglycan/xylan/chitin deacetylase (PgdA/CDA1 family)